MLGIAQRLAEITGSDVATRMLEADLGGLELFAVGVDTLLATQALHQLLQLAFGDFRADLVQAFAADFLEGLADHLLEFFRFRPADLVSDRKPGDLGGQ